MTQPRARRSRTRAHVDSAGLDANDAAPRAIPRHPEIAITPATASIRSTRALERLLRDAEAMGIAATERKWRTIPPGLARRLRPRTAHVADAFATSLGSSDSLRMNRAIGFGHRGQASERALDDIVAFYAGTGVPRFSLVLGPGPQAVEIARWLERRGFERHGGDLLLRRDLRTPLEAPGGSIVVRRARGRAIETAYRIFAATFAMPESRREWSLAEMKVAGLEHFLAYAGSRAIGAGTLGLGRGMAWLWGGATLTRWRRSGAHTALILARLSRSRRAGCRWVWVETIAPRRGRPDGSRRNLVRLGFEPVRIKPVYVWTRSQRRRRAQAPRARGRDGYASSDRALQPLPRLVMCPVLSGSRVSMRGGRSWHSDATCAAREPCPVTT